MRFKKRLLVAFLSVACVTMGAIGFSACSDNKTADNDSDIYVVYQLYASAEEAEGNTPLSYEDWLLTIKGADGKDGADGADGADGKDGADGIGITGAVINENGELVLTYSDGTSVNLDVVVGKDGADGADGADGKDGTNGVDGKDGKDGKDGTDGIGIASAVINENSELVLTYSDGTSVNLGVVVGKDGADGVDGADGADGKDGTDGTDGADGLSAYEIAVKNGFTGTEEEWINSFGSAENHTHEYNVTQFGYECDEDGYLLYECIVDGCNLSYIVHNWRDHLYVDNICIYCGQNGLTSYSGYVYPSISDSENANTPLSGATIKLYNGDTLVYETKTDIYGYFCFNEIILGNYIVIITISGYYDITFELNATIQTGTDTTNYYADIVQNSSITGIVTIADADMDSSNNCVLEGATVNITKLTGTNKIEYTYVTGTDGSYTFSHLPAGTYQIVVSKDGYIVLTQNISVAQNQTAVQNMALELITESTGNVTIGYVSGMIYDANVQGNVGVEGLTLYIRVGINIITSTVVKIIYTTTNGAYSVNLEAGNYTVTIVDERTLEDENYRYTSSSFNIKVLAGKTISNQNGSVSNSISHVAGSLTIVLTWGSTPSDLDSHITGPTSSGSRFHVYYQSMTYGSVSLDRDDTSSYGPETITVDSVKDGIYRYSVHDYTNRSRTTSTSLANSGATVTLYLDGNLYATYYVPSGVGTLWTVFEYNSETGVVTPINTLSNESDPSSVS